MSNPLFLLSLPNNTTFNGVQTYLALEWAPLIDVKWRFDSLGWAEDHMCTLLFDFISVFQLSFEWTSVVNLWLFWSSEMRQACRHSFSISIGVSIYWSFVRLSLGFYLLHFWGMACFAKEYYERVVWFNSKHPHQIIIYYYLLQNLLIYSVYSFICMTFIKHALNIYS